MSKKAYLGDFLITDPLAQPNVVETVPEGVEMIDLDDVPYRAEPQVRCAFCQHHQWHNDGYFALLSNGQRAPCGNCCAAKFDVVKKSTIDRNRRRLKRERDNRDRARAIACGLEDIPNLVDFAEEVVAAVSPALLLLPRILTEEARYDMVTYGIEGLTFLDGCSAHLDFVRKSVSRIRQTEGITEREEEQFLTLRNEAQNEARIAITFVLECANFFKPENLVAAEIWAKSRGSQFGIRQFKVKNKVLHMKGPTEWRNIPLPEIELPLAVEAFARSSLG